MYIADPSRPGDVKQLPRFPCLSHLPNLFFVKANNILFLLEYIYMKKGRGDWRGPFVASKVQYPSFWPEWMWTNGRTREEHECLVRCGLGGLWRKEFGNMQAVIMIHVREGHFEYFGVSPLFTASFISQNNVAAYRNGSLREHHPSSQGAPNLILLSNTACPGIKKKVSPFWVISTAMQGFIKRCFTSMLLCQDVECLGLPSKLPLSNVAYFDTVLCFRI